MTGRDPIGHISFNAGRVRKRALKMLEAKLDMPDMTELLKYIVDLAVQEHLPDELAVIREEDPKPWNGRQRKNQAAKGGEGKVA